MVSRVQNAKVGIVVCKGKALVCAAFTNASAKFATDCPVIVDVVTCVDRVNVAALLRPKDVGTINPLAVFVFEIPILNQHIETVVIDRAQRIPECRVNKVAIQRSRLAVVR